MEEKRFYVYAYYLKSTNHIFHIGKGTGNRYKDKKTHRNQYFLNMINKHQEDIDVKILQDNLTEQEAWDLERKLIIEYKKEGQCETNLHEGGCGGNTGNYNNPERSKKLSDFAKTRVGNKNPNFGNKWDQEQRDAASQRVSKWWEEHPEAKEKMSKIHKGKIPWNKGLTKNNNESLRKISEQLSNRKITEEHYNKMMDKDCPYLYQVFLEGNLVFEDIGLKRLEKYCHDNLGISRTIITKVLDGEWMPTFRKHQHLKTLQIIRIDRKCID